jgi:hypothetical protein
MGIHLEHEFASRNLCPYIDRTISLESLLVRTIKTHQDPLRCP